MLLCKEILEWRDGFVRTPVFRKLAGCESVVNVYYGGWGHSPGGFGGSSWVILGKSGRLEYAANYKWFPVSIKVSFDNVKDAAKTLGYDYLLALFKHLSSGKVYDLIAKELKNRTSIILAALER